MKKEETPITLKNGGMHNQPQYKKMKDMLLTHSFLSPRLYHIVLTGSQEPEVYNEAMKALCRELRRKNMPCKWKACVERDEEKGVHLHAFILVENKYANPCSILHYKNDNWLVGMLAKRGLAFHISQPKNPIHRTSLGKKKNFAYVAKGEKLADCLIWISYLVKRRSKDDSMKTIYFSSRERAFKKTEAVEQDQAVDSMVCVTEELGKELIHVSGATSCFPNTDNDNDKGDDMTLTTSQKYIAGLYERAVDKQLDLEEIRKYLLSKGVPRSLGLIEYELEHTYGFYGYAATHRALPTLSQEQWDKKVDRAAPVKPRLHAIPKPSANQLLTC